MAAPQFCSSFSHTQVSETNLHQLAANMFVVILFVIAVVGVNAQSYVFVYPHWFFLAARLFLLIFFQYSTSPELPRATNTMRASFSLIRSRYWKWVNGWLGLVWWIPHLFRTQQLSSKACICRSCWPNCHRSVSHAQIIPRADNGLAFCVRTPRPAKTRQRPLDEQSRPTRSLTARCCRFPVGARVSLRMPQLMYDKKLAMASILA
jgi:hypothetical protein